MFNLGKKKIDNGVRRSRETWFSKITRLFERATIDESIWAELEELLISADVAVSTTSKLIDRTKQRVKQERLSSGDQVYSVLKEEMTAILLRAKTDLPPRNGATRILLVVGVNGSGKTTSIAKLAMTLKSAGETVLLAAADTFRAAAIDQLKLWGERVGVPVIAHQPGSDPGAVVYDALEASRARSASVVIIDTAGRLHTKFNLMEELKKIQRIAVRWDPSSRVEVLMVIDATTGQNGLTQAKSFTQAAPLDGIILSKLDGTARGGIVLTISDDMRIPILYIGTGEQIDDLSPFDASDFVNAIFARAEGQNSD
jgi:fused signal recognition particle receptor